MRPLAAETPDGPRRAISVATLAGCAVVLGLTLTSVLWDRAVLGPSVPPCPLGVQVHLRPGASSGHTPATPARGQRDSVVSASRGDVEQPSVLRSVVRNGGRAAQDCLPPPCLPFARGHARVQKVRAEASACPRPAPLSPRGAASAPGAEAPPPGPAGWPTASSPRRAARRPRGPPPRPSTWPPPPGSHGPGSKRGWAAPWPRGGRTAHTPSHLVCAAVRGYQPPRQLPPCTAAPSAPDSRDGRWWQRTRATAKSRRRRTRRRVARRCAERAVGAPKGLAGGTEGRGRPGRPNGYGGATAADRWVRPRRWPVAHTTMPHTPGAAFPPRGGDVNPP